MERNAPPWFGDEAGIVVDWLLKLILVIGLIGIALVEAAGLGIARYTAEEGASAAASGAAQAIRTGGVAGDPQALAAGAAGAHGCRLVSIEQNRRAGTVIVTVERRATTFFLHRIERLQGLSRVRATEETSYLTS